MASVAEIVEGLEILAKTAGIPRGLAAQGETDTRTAHLNGAEHDIIFGPDSTPLPRDVNRLNELGWHFDSEFGCWSHFV